MRKKRYPAPAGGREASELRETYDIGSSEDNYGESLAQAASDPRRQRLAERVHKLGPTGLLAFAVELVATGDLDETLERFGGVDTRVLQIFGLDEFVPPPIRRVA